MSGLSNGWGSWDAPTTAEAPQPTVTTEDDEARQRELLELYNTAGPEQRARIMSKLPTYKPPAKSDPTPDKSKLSTPKPGRVQVMSVAQASVLRKEIRERPDIRFGEATEAVGRLRITTYPSEFTDVYEHPILEGGAVVKPLVRIWVTGIAGDLDVLMIDSHVVSLTMRVIGERDNCNPEGTARIAAELESVAKQAKVGIIVVDPVPAWHVASYVGDRKTTPFVNEQGRVVDLPAIPAKRPDTEAAPSNDDPLAQPEPPEGVALSVGGV
jgi:hypothetical protein